MDFVNSVHGNAGSFVHVNMLFKQRLVCSPLFKWTPTLCRIRWKALVLVVRMFAWSFPLTWTGRGCKRTWMRWFPSPLCLCFFFFFCYRVIAWWSSSSLLSPAPCPFAIVHFLRFSLLLHQSLLFFYRVISRYPLLSFVSYSFRDLLVLSGDLSIGVACESCLALTLYCFFFFCL